MPDYALLEARPQLCLPHGRRTKARMPAIALQMAWDTSLRRNMRRREFLAAAGGIAVAWPLAAAAQTPARTRRVAVLMLYAESDPQGEARAAAFRQGL